MALRGWKIAGWKYNISIQCIRYEFHNKRNVKNSLPFRHPFDLYRQIYIHIHKIDFSYERAYERLYVLANWEKFWPFLLLGRFSIFARTFRPLLSDAFSSSLCIPFVFSYMWQKIQKWIPCSIRQFYCIQIEMGIKSPNAKCITYVLLYVLVQSEKDIKEMKIFLFIIIL